MRITNNALRVKIDYINRKLDRNLCVVAHSPGDRTYYKVVEIDPTHGNAEHDIFHGNSKREVFNFLSGMVYAIDN